MSKRPATHYRNRSLPTKKTGHIFLEKSIFTGDENSGNSYLDLKNKITFPDMSLVCAAAKLVSR